MIKPMFVAERIFLPLALAVSATVCAASFASAEVVETATNSLSSQPASTSEVESAPANPLVLASERLNQRVPLQASTQPSEANAAPAQPASQKSVASESAAVSTPSQPDVAPAPGTAATTAATLSTESSAGATESIAQPAPTAAGSSVVAQDVDPGTATRSGSSYIGIGGNIGLADGATDVGDGAFAVISKIGLTRLFSVRPSVLIGDGVTILIPATIDFPTATSVGEFGIAPFLGLGLAIATDADDALNGLATAGVDVPITAQFTATGSVNVTFGNETDVGILLGVGYNFSGL